MFNIVLFIIRLVLAGFLQGFTCIGFTRVWQSKIYTLERKPMIPHLLRCRGLAVADYSFTLGRLGSGASSTFAQGYIEMARAMGHLRCRRFSGRLDTLSSSLYNCYKCYSLNRSFCTLKCALNFEGGSNGRQMYF